MKEHHYVVSWSEKSGWSINVDLEESAFPDGTIYDHETHEWSHAYQGEGEWQDNEQELTEELQSILDLHNEHNGKVML
jgi:hypothetical protein